MLVHDDAANLGAASVAPDYRHYDKEIVPRDPIALPGTLLKWYDVERAEEPVPDEIQRLARQFLKEEAATPALDLRDQLGFVILHRCGEAFYFLIVSVWRNNNELWEAVYSKDAGTPGFQLHSRERSPLETFCVWELGAVLHEQQAFIRYLRTTRDSTALNAYRADQYAGPV